MLFGTMVTGRIPFAIAPNEVQSSPNLVWDTVNKKLRPQTISFATASPTGVQGSFITTEATWVQFATAGACGIKLLCANLSPTGNFASLRIRARSDVATPTWNQNTLAGDFSASTNIDDYGELVGVSSYAQDNGKNQARVSHWSTGIKACSQHTGTSAGSRYALVVSDYSTTKAGTAHYLARYDKPAGACGIDGIFTFGNCDQMTYFGRFEVAGGFLTDTGDAGSTKAGFLLVHTPAGDKKIQLVTT
jgi:hypothetical protein